MKKRPNAVITEELYLHILVYCTLLQFAVLTCHLLRGGFKTKNRSNFGICPNRGAGGQTGGVGRPNLLSGFFFYCFFGFYML